MPENYEKTKFSQRLNHFAGLWLSISDYDLAMEDEFLTLAREFGIDLRAKYIALTIYSPEPIQEDPGRFNLPYLELDEHRVTFIAKQATKFSKIFKALKNAEHSGVGNPHFDLSRSIGESIYALAFSSDNSPHLRYQDIERFSPFFQQAHHQSFDLEKQLEQISQTDNGRILLETFWQYVINNINVNEVADIMSVHRNTVAYRLNQLNLMTDYNPRDTKDLTMLIYAFVVWRTCIANILLKELQSISDLTLPRDDTTP